MRELNANELLDTYDAINATYRPYPSDWGIKIGKTSTGYEMVDNDGNAKTASGLAGYFTSRMPLTQTVDKTITEYTVSCSVTGKERGDWGGFGMTFGWSGDAPVVLTYLEAGTLVIAENGSEYAHSVYAPAATTAETEDTEGNEGETPTEPAIAPFEATGTYALKVVMSGGTATVYVNNKAINQVDLSALEIVPAVGVSLKNYTAVYSDFVLEVPATSGGETPEEPVDPADAVTPADFADAANLSVSTKGLIDSYGAISEFQTQQPFPSDWGMKVYEIKSGVFTRTNNATTPYINASFTASYLPTSKDVHAVSTYYVEATAKPTERNDWGGVGIVIGRSTADATKGAPVVVWVNEAGGVTVSYDFTEWAASAGAAEAVTLNTNMKIAAVVDAKNVVVYINDVRIGKVDLSAVEFVPTLGISFKNWNAEFSGVTFKTLDTAADAAKYTVYQISGGVEIGSKEYTYGSEVTLEPVERKGNTFMGWHLLPDLSDGVIDKLSATTGGDVYVYCEYIVTNYTIKYYDGETELDNESLVKNYNYREYVSLDELKKEGYTFEGWYETADFAGEKVEAITMGSTGDKVFYAKYTKVGGNDNNKKVGCKGNIASGSLALSVLALATVAVLLKKKKVEQK